MTIAARIRELYAEGKTSREIADAVGREANYVRAVLSKARKGLRSRRGRPNKIALAMSNGPACVNTADPSDH